MTSLEDCKAIMSAAEEAREKGARLSAICEVIGVDRRTLQRWSGPEALTCGDARPTAQRPAPASRLSDGERAAILLQRLCRSRVRHGEVRARIPGDAMCGAMNHQMAAKRFA